MRELIWVAALATITAVGLAPTLLDLWRRRHWRQLIAHVDAAYYAPRGETLRAWVDVSLGHGESVQHIRGLLRKATRIEDLHMGDQIGILVSPRNSRHCVIDE